MINQFSEIFWKSRLLQLLPVFLIALLTLSCSAEIVSEENDSTLDIGSLTELLEDIVTAEFEAIETEVEESGGLSISLSVVLDKAAPSDKLVKFRLLSSETTAEENLDFNLDKYSSYEIMIPAGEIKGHLELEVLNDKLDEVEETITFALVSSGDVNIGSRANHMVLIQDDDLPPVISFGSNSKTVLESTANHTILVVLSEVSGKDITFNLTAKGLLATQNIDFSLNSGGTFTIPKGTSSYEAPFKIINDGLKEQDESFRLTLSTNDAKVSSVNSNMDIIIQDDEGALNVSFAETGSSVTENSVGAISIELSSASALGVQVDYSINVGSSNAETEDYSLTTGTLVFTNGETAINISIQAVDDLLDEEDFETVVIELSNPVNALLGLNAAHTVKIADNDSQPNISFSSLGQTIGESTTDVPIKVGLQLSAPSEKTISFNYGVSTTEHISGSGSGTIVIDPLDVSADIDMIISAEDDSHTDDQNFSITLSTLKNAGISEPASHTITVAEFDDSLKTVSFGSVSTNTLSEGASINIPVTLSSALNSSVSVHFSTNNISTTSNDYSISTSPLVFSAGETSKNITLNINNDSLSEKLEKFNLALTSNSQLNLGSSSSIAFTINSTKTSVNFSSSTNTALEYSSSLKNTQSVSITLDEIVEIEESIAYTVTGTATPEEDYTGLISGILTIPAGQSSADITFDVLQDTVNESDETVIISLGTLPSHMQAGNITSYTLTIEDDDATVTLSWSGNKEKMVNSLGGYYRLYYSTTTGFTDLSNYVDVTYDSLLEYTPISTTLNLSQLATDTTYFFKLKAFGKATVDSALAEYSSQLSDQWSVTVVAH